VSSPTARFPLEFWEIVELVGEQEQTMHLLFPSEALARNFRQRIYKFRARAIKELTASPAGEAKIIALDALYITVENLEPQGYATHRGKPWQVTIAPRSTTPDAVLIRAEIDRLRLKGEQDPNA
jgi:hypothetical protein